MPSINLLPENFTIEAYKKREKIAIYILAVFFLLSSVVLFAYAQIGKMDLEKSSNVLDTEIANVRKEIEAEIEKSDLLSSEYNKKDIDKILKEHTYPSKINEFLRYSIIESVYLKEIELDSETGSMKIEVAATDADSLSRQMYIFSDSYWVDSAKFGDIDYSTEDLLYSMSAVLSLKKDLLVFHEQYWEYATEPLVSVANRYVKISNFSAAKQDKKDDNGKEEVVVVDFSGKAHNQDYLNDFENRLKIVSGVKNLTIKSVDVPDDKPGIVSFKGNMELNYAN